MGDCFSKKRSNYIPTFIEKFSPKKIKNSPLLLRSPQIINHKCENCNNLFFGIKNLPTIIKAGF